MVASPVYGDIMRDSKNRFFYTYNEYSERLAKEIGVDIKEIKLLFASLLLVLLIMYYGKMKLRCGCS